MYMCIGMCVIVQIYCISNIVVIIVFTTTPMLTLLWQNAFALRRGEGVEGVHLQAALLLLLLCVVCVVVLGIPHL